MAANPVITAAVAAENQDYALLARMVDLSIAAKSGNVARISLAAEDARDAAEVLVKLLGAVVDQADQTQFEAYERGYERRALSWPPRLFGLGRPPRGPC